MFFLFPPYPYSRLLAPGAFRFVPFLQVLLQRLPSLLTLAASALELSDPCAAAVAHVATVFKSKRGSLEATLLCAAMRPA